MGTPNFALKSLIALNKNFDVQLVVTQPDKPVGRKKQIILSPVKEYCIGKNLNCIQPKTIKNNQELLDTLRKKNPDIICVAAYGKILSKEILEIPKIGCINIHASLLPKFRGASPISRAIIDGEIETGITLMKMDVGMDTGDIISKSKLNIDKTDTTLSLTNKLADLGAEEIIKLFKKLSIKPKLSLTKQDDRLASLAPKMEKKDGIIDWKSNFNQINNIVRGCDPWPIAHTTLNGIGIKIFKIQIHQSEKLPAGHIKKINSGMIVGCKDANIEILEIQKNGQRKMSGKDFVNGISKIKKPLFT